MSTTKITKKDLLNHAKPLNIKGASKLKKTDLIHAIQNAEGNNPCFLTIDNCSVSPCLYRAECQA
ncbi:MAG: Rho termination factor N-terminal domain-containing protein [Ghiorsea sp.]|nr:Rho termination factor N-terminal domain-containing protein [Ghiorsea sp.]